MLVTILLISSCIADVHAREKILDVSRLTAADIEDELQVFPRVSCRTSFRFRLLTTYSNVLSFRSSTGRNRQQRFRPPALHRESSPSSSQEALRSMLS